MGVPTTYYDNTKKPSLKDGEPGPKFPVNASAEAELAQLETAVAAKKKAVVEKGNEKAGKAREMGNKEAQRAQQGSTERGRRAEEIGSQKTAQYRNGENGAEIASNIHSEVPKLVQKFFQIGNDVASGVREKAGEVAGHFREEAREIAGEFNKSQGDARQQILENRNKTLETLQKMADDAATQLSNQTNDLVQKLSTDKASKVVQIRELAPGLSASLDENVRDALTKIDKQTASTSQELNSFAEQVKEGGWYPPFVQNAKAEVLASIASQQSEQQQFVAQVVGSFGQATSTAQAEVTGQAQTIISAVEQVGNDFQTNASKIADDTKGKMQEASGKGEESMKLVTQEVEKKLQEAVDKSDSEWEKQLSEKATKISGEVDKALAKEDGALNDFSAEIDARAARAADPGILEAIWDFVAGVFEGIVIGAWETLKAIWEAIKEPLFWIVVAVVAVVLVIAVIVLVIKGAAVLAAIGAVLVFASKVLLVIGVIAGVIAAGYYIYLMITQPDLSPRERGRLMGRAIFEVIMAFAGTGILKRLGVFAQLGRLRQLVARVGGVAKALRLINKVPDLEKLFLLLDKVSDADKLIQLLDKVNDADKLIQLLDKVGDLTKLTQLLDKVGDVNKLIQLLDKLNDTEKLIQLLDKIGDADKLIQLLDKINDIEKLVQLIDKINDVDKLIQLLDKVSDADKLVQLIDQVKDIDQLALLIDKAKDADQLIQLLNKFTDLEILGKLLDEAGSAQKLIDLLNELDNPIQLLQLLKQVRDPDALIELLRWSKDPLKLRQLLSQVDDVSQILRLKQSVNNVDDLGRLLNKAAYGNTSPGLRIERAIKNYLGSGRHSISEIQEAIAKQQKIDSKILHGEQPNPHPPGTAPVGNQRRIIGGHSPDILTHPNFQIISQTTNSDGTITAKFRKLLNSGSPPVWSKPKTSTLAPPGWTQDDILRAGDAIAKEPIHLGPRTSDGATLHIGDVNGVKWVVIKDNTGKVTSSYPSGGSVPTSF